MRKDQAISDPKFQEDERLFETLVKEVSDYANRIVFFNSENVSNPSAARGSWKKFIDIDEIVVLAHLKSFDLKSLEDIFYSNLNYKKVESGETKLSTYHLKAIVTANELSRLLDKWHKTLSRIPKSAIHYPIYLEWDLAIKGLKERTKMYWDIEKYSDTNQGGLVESEVKELDTFFKTLVKTTIFLKSKYDRFLELAKSHQTHEPHNGLLFAFLDLFKYAQKSINTFQQRHLDYYYHDQLKLSPRSASPDRVILQFELDDTFKNFLLPGHTPFIAGQTEGGEDIVYKTTDDLFIDTSRVEKLKGVFVARDKNAIHLEESPAEEILAADYPINSEDDPWPVLDMSTHISDSYVSSAEIGFAISSPNLLLREGDREITLLFQGRTEFLELDPIIKAKIKKEYSASKTKHADPKIRDILSKISRESQEEITLEEFFRKAFKVTRVQSPSSIYQNFVERILNLEAGKWANKAITLSETGAYPTDIKLSEFIDILSNETRIKKRESLKTTMLKMLIPSYESDEQKPDNQKRLQTVIRRFKRVFNDALSVYYSTTEDWQKITPISIEFNTGKQSQYQLKIVLVIPDNLPGIDMNPSTVFEFPTLRFLVNPDASFYAYDFLEKLRIQQIKCSIKVKGARDLTLYNQVGQINPDAPFLPFGPTPNNYSYFLIGNKEIFQKKFTQLQLNIDWMDLPTYIGGFKVHYAKYGLPVENDCFKAEISTLASGTWLPKSGEREVVSLFKNTEILETKSTFNLETHRLDTGSNFDWNPDELEYNKLSKRGFLKVQLTSPSFSFGHAAYPNLLSQMAIQNAKKLTGIMSMFNKKDFQMDLPNVPYTPKIDRISMDYSVEFKMDYRERGQNRRQPKDSFFHLLPFNGIKKNLVASGNVALIPSFRNEGELYVGIRGFKSPGSLSLFFDMKEREVEQDATSSGFIQWSYLHNNEWRHFKPHQIPVDTTTGLIHSGIVKLDIPAVRRSENTLLNKELLWIRIGASRETRILGKVISLTTHAVEAKYDQQKVENKKNEPILPNSILEPLLDIPQLATINQPLASFGGKKEEEEPEFKIRVSERLRHKNRCVNMYDYERLILEEFPEVNKALCINSFNWKTNDEKPGKVLIVLVPNTTDIKIENVSRPTNSIKTLRNVKKMVRSRSSVFADIDVINPTYEPMRVFSKVKIKDGKSVGFYLRKLNDELKNFITPWINDPSQEPLFQRRIAREEVQSFIQSRDYVDFVTKVSMVKVDVGEHTKTQRPYHLKDTGLKLDSDNEIEGRYPWSILTTAKQHHLESIFTDKSDRPDHAGVDELYVDEDFVIKK